MEGDICAEARGVGGVEDGAREGADGRVGGGGYRGDGSEGGWKGVADVWEEDW